MPSLNDIFHGQKATPRANVQNAAPEAPAQRSRASVKTRSEAGGSQQRSGNKAPTKKENTEDGKAEQPGDN